MSSPKVLAFVGSIRRDSMNRKLLRVAAAGAQEAGAAVTLLDLADYPLPIYDGDLEAAEGIPKNAHKLKDLFLQHHALLIACPEYNSSITPLLKNTIDWVSRPRDADGGPLGCFKGKTAGLVAASGGNLGGLRGLVHVRAILSNIAVLVVPEQFALAKGDTAFDEAGRLKDAGAEKSAKGVGAATARVAASLLVR